MIYGFNDDKTKVDVGAILEGLESTYQSNVNTIYNAFVNKGVTPTAKTPTALSTAVNTTYNKGVTDAQAITWTETLVASAYRVSGSGYLDLDFYIPYKNTKKIKNVSNKSIRLSVVKNTGTEDVTLANNEEYTPNGNILRIIAGIQIQSSEINEGITVEVTFQAKVLR